MKKLRLFVAAVTSSSIALSPVVGLAASGSGVDGNTSTGSTSTAPAVNTSGNNAGSANSTGTALNALTSASEFAVAAQNWSRCPEDGSACAIAAIFTAYGILSLKQAKENANKASQAYNTASDSNAYGTGSYDSTGTSSSGSGTGTDYAAVGSNYIKQAEAGLASLKAAGVVNSSATKITSPDGTSYKTSDMTSAASMAAAGLPQGAIDAAQSTSDKIAQKAMDKLKIGALTKVSGYEEGSSGGGGSRSPGSDGSSSGAYPGYAGAGSGARTSLLDKDPSKLVSGMSKNYNGEPIGVAADSIFLMMSRRYKVKESQDSFFGASDIDLKK
ncbi:hypothetical protein B9G69_008825 [Bdellovibrio sp. SKB1291214]|uniref:hypothetical protein n=1 Tax=Bdellovibrio sp. SKB1291214 TaxID=1732569 RepID=UPI000B51AE8D|nr:hypothetical protein [Bdellovibrio sp. SKB1291214]UYL10677.1 hypothetical protein B9G69_008825 [Bdellovibrio sp. SKB1291214]